MLSVGSEKKRHNMKVIIVVILAQTFFFFFLYKHPDFTGKVIHHWKQCLNYIIKTLVS